MTTLHLAQQKAIRRREPAANARLWQREAARYWTVELFDPTVPNGRQFGLPPSVVLHASREIKSIVAQRQLARMLRPLGLWTRDGAMVLADVSHGTPQEAA